MLERAFALRLDAPDEAADLLADAGPGPLLERARIDAWLGVLERTTDGAARWRRLLDAGPNQRVAAAATLALADALVAEGKIDDAVSVLDGAPAPARNDADLRLLDLADPVGLRAVADRLAVDHPAMLRDHSRSLERTVLRDLDHHGWLRRAAAWRRAGLGSRAAAELRQQRWSGPDEVERRLELARCEIDAGSSSRALQSVAPIVDQSAEARTLRAEAYRIRAWGRMPDRAAAASFGRCRDEARKAVELASAVVPVQALELAVECGTEAGDLDTALAAWRRLEAVGWGDGRRSWLGRRLGVALARAGAPAELIEELAGALPRDARCLRYWHSIGDPAGLDVLADVEVADLYALWAQSRGGRTPATGGTVGRPAAAAAATPPRSVAWLLEHGTVQEASDEWQRINLDRRPTRAEAVGAAELAVRAGRPNTAIRTVLQVVPDLGSVAITDAPADIVRLYLPLRWDESLVRAARDTGLPPWLIAAVARQESTFSAHARSPAGAVGVLQLIPSTARGHAVALGFGPHPDLGDPAVNIAVGARELAWLVRWFGELEPALAAYNAGETRVRRWWRRWPDREVFTESIPIPETYSYVRRVTFLADAYRRVHADAWRTTP